MKSFKVLFMLAGLSSVVRASDLPEESFFTKAVQVISENAAKATDVITENATKAKDVLACLAKNAQDKASTYFEKTSEVVVAPVVETPVAESYMTQLYTKASELTSSAVTASSDFANTAVKNTTELANSVAKNASEFGTTVSTKASELGSSVAATSSDLYNQAGVKTSEMTAATAKFVEENQQAVIITSVVATALAVTAIVRYNVYGYVFYQSEKADDQK